MPPVTNVALWIAEAALFFVLWFVLHHRIDNDVLCGVAIAGTGFIINVLVAFLYVIVMRRS